MPANQPNQAVTRVSWQEAVKFCAWLSDKTGRRVSLPTEAQWEFACRAGTTTPMWYGNVDADFGKFENLADTNLLHLTVRDSPQWLPVIASVNDGSVGVSARRYQPNPWGFFDLHGNVAEWTLGDEIGRKVVRGGSFYDRPYRATAASRRFYLPHQPVFDVGFRVAVAATEDAPQKR